MCMFIKHSHTQHTEYFYHHKRFFWSLWGPSVFPMSVFNTWWEYYEHLCCKVLCVHMFFFFSWVNMSWLSQKLKNCFSKLYHFTFLSVMNKRCSDSMFSSTCSTVNLFHFSYLADLYCDFNFYFLDDMLLLFNY